MPPTHHLLGWLLDALPDISNLILAVLGVLMSLPKLAENIEDRTPVRYTVAVICIGLGFGGFLTGISQRRNANIKMTTLVNTVNDSKTQISAVQTQLNQSLLSQGRVEGQLQLISGAVQKSGVKELMALVNIGHPPSLLSLDDEQLHDVALGLAQRMRQFDVQYKTFIQKESGSGGHGVDWQLHWEQEKYTPQLRHLFLEEFTLVRNELLKRLKQSQTELEELNRPRNRFINGDATQLAIHLEGLAEQLVPTRNMTF